MLESHQRQQDVKVRQERARLRDMATILDGFGTLLLNNLFLSEGDKAIHMKDVIPELYHTEPMASNHQEEQSQAAAEMELYKAQRLYHAYCFNKNRKGKNEDHGCDHVRDT